MSLKRKVIAFCGRRILDSLGKVEAEMKEIVHRESSEQSGSEKTDYVQVQYERGLSIRLEEIDPFLLAMERKTEDCLTVSELEEKLLLFEEARSRVAAISLCGLKKEILSGADAFETYLQNCRCSLSILRYHGSSYALRLNAFLSCILGCVNVTNYKGMECDALYTCDACDYTLLQPFFRMLVEKLHFLFPLSAPMDESKILSPLYCPETFECVQATAAAVVYFVLLNATRELPFAFASGIIREFLEFCADFKYASPFVLILTVQRIRERCIAFMLPARISRVEQSDPIEEEEEEENKPAVVRRRSRLNVFPQVKVADWKFVSFEECVCCPAMCRIRSFLEKKP
ncbi:uncharacterized protein MONOS_3543 [Monocercomonoides exilis]|uniref:uncharacterized protein n=1 Tax=Monocercomonoides exilis TaxID=2049356 RepID=UPI00355A6881|nr:hypothetical protein MONOS_3543 [Monocercomonoides exilis]|eukprot:MONOS_3543.1-p1 / transcript=MONOS_3543.1 / gene=MONOS_3543 / organism=Monocercomonoides_exilis_PA203 / gene_product=unspecified product / transcript_product=unspecified product / location=Mono_scaffold00084:46677-47708(+) / protein_length=344 / sequence_SO=supercontig / SO=protein_coding / is_pseudo=false